MRFVRFEIDLRRGEIAAAVVLLVLALAIVWTAVLMPAGTMGTPGPGLFPRALGSLLALTSIALLIRAWRLPSDRPETIALGHTQIWLTVLVLAVVAFIFERAGYLISAALFMVVLLRAFGGITWTRAALAAIATSLISYYVFVRVLGVGLPPGVLPLPV